MFDIILWLWCTSFLVFAASLFLKLLRVGVIAFVLFIVLGGAGGGLQHRELDEQRAKVSCPHCGECFHE